ncbi:hypothetical protein MPTK1_2g07910 [Marchantia polymorpha subsp. ruderalis]|uniref:Uncharacterized protein n=1 Tax=Marchantia polymorpha TaxID=3197 RepID=A0A2R6XGM7_MARPO|nr:hypothetical protein MARPO_0015s0077 [Marchantia polymorpha]BBN01502.1 hypothetical protein Mp_2g07910 [Marchantia polymorpha subsp. ruderalis]|eukprot:PTQ45270.1 hypothetical protein MARPO_0015s0077 [Marchantia polymorpha]
MSYLQRGGAWLVVSGQKGIGRVRAQHFGRSGIVQKLQWNRQILQEQSNLIHAAHRRQPDQLMFCSQQVPENSDSLYPTTFAQNLSSDSNVNPRGSLAQPSFAPTS